jgi:hypothetical protein
LIVIDQVDKLWIFIVLFRQGGSLAELPGRRSGIGGQAAFCQRQIRQRRKDVICFINIFLAAGASCRVITITMPGIQLSHYRMTDKLHSTQTNRK